MSKVRKFRQALQEMHSDIRLEVVLADLLSDNWSMEDVVLVNNSLFKRNYHRDIEHTGEVEYGITRKTKLCFFVNREGIYDQLPEDLFHQVTTLKTNAGKEEAILEIKTQQEIEKQSRLFFLPIEHEFYRQRVKLEVEERKFLFQTNTVLPGEIFGGLWDFPECLDELQKSKLGMLMPVVHKITGNIPLLAFVMESITGNRVAIDKCSPASHRIPDEPALGGCQLGLTAILGGEIRALQSGFGLTIFINRHEAFSDYMPGGKKLAVHEFLCGLLMPLDTDIVFESDFSGLATSFIVENETSFLGRLNYTSII